MIRKQVYLTKEANEKLIQLAQDRNTSQAELIREGIESYLISIEENERRTGWEQLLDKMHDSSMKLDQWDRDEVYIERQPNGKKEN